MRNNLSLKVFALILVTLAVFAGYGKASAAVPNVPTLFYPANGANVGGTMISFTWNPVSNVTYYWLVASDKKLDTISTNMLSIKHIGFI